MLTTGTTSCNLCLNCWADKVADEPLGCSWGAGGVLEGRGTLCHKFSLSSIEVEDDLPGQLLSTDWHHNELHLNVYQESLLVTHKDWVVW